jgi:hypothetical protein
MDLADLFWRISHLFFPTEGCGALKFNMLDLL